MITGNKGTPSVLKCVYRTPFYKAFLNGKGIENTRAGGMKLKYLKDKTL